MSDVLNWLLVLQGRGLKQPTEYYDTKTKPSLRKHDIIVMKSDKGNK